ncbi:MAG TPA: hypothetical protein VNW92_05985, partial [Polyangiaceae bacterium]|nr:hypothetical protein [Polyangiaceae bacterium]
GNDPVGIEVVDWDGDGLPAVAVSYANNKPTRRVFLAYPDGFRPLDPARSTIAKSTKVVTRLWEGGKLFWVSLNDGGPNNTIHASMIGEDGKESPPLDTGIPFVEPLAVIRANFNNDAVPFKDPYGKVGQTPLEDVAIMSGRRLVALLGHPDLTLTLNPLNAPPDTEGMGAEDVTGDGVDDLWVERADGTKLWFTGIPGAKGGLTSTPRTRASVSPRAARTDLRDRFR